VRVVGIDPGKTTGFVVVETTPKKAQVKFCGQIDCSEDANTVFGRTLAEVIHEYGIEKIGCERFVIAQRTLSLTRELDALYVIGVARYIAALQDVTLRLQTPADAKSAWRDGRIDHNVEKRTIKGNVPFRARPHARDALRHALLISDFVGLVPERV
jgi:Holliday junction resolvasome RuvABC endonuclease subunit